MRRLAELGIRCATSSTRVWHEGGRGWVWRIGPPGETFRTGPRHPVTAPPVIRSGSVPAPDLSEQGGAGPVAPSGTGSLGVLHEVDQGVIDRRGYAVSAAQR